MSLIKIVPEENLDKRKEQFLAVCESDPNRNQAYLNLSFEQGRKVSLEIEITDRYLSQILFGLLYNWEDIEGAEFLGFKITSIHLGTVANRDCFIRELEQLISKLQAGQI